MKQQLAPRDLALTLAVVALWGFSFVPIKVGLREVPPFALAALRFFFAAVPLVFFVRRPRMPAGVVIAYGVAIGVFQFGLLFLGMKLGMPAGLSSIVIQVQVFFTIGLGIAFLGDRLRGENVAGAAIAVLGVVLLAVYKVQSGLATTLAGLLIVLVADLFLKERTVMRTSTIAAVGMLAALIPIATLVADGTDRVMFGGAYVVDDYALALKALFVVATYLTILLSVDYVG